MSEDKITERPADEGLTAEQGSKGSVVWGFGQVLLFHLLQIPLAAVTMFLSLAVISVSQLAYVIPAIVVARRKGHEETVKGIIIAASVSALLNIACTGYVFYNLKIN